MTSHDENGNPVFKIVIYGPTKTGKTEFLRWICNNTNFVEIPMQSIEDKVTGSTLFYDRVVVKLANSRFHVYGTPGAKNHYITRRSLLKETDAIVFFWDSDPTREEENIAILGELTTFLGERITSKNPSMLFSTMLVKRTNLSAQTRADHVRAILKKQGFLSTAALDSIQEISINEGENLEMGFTKILQDVLIKY